MSMTGQYNDGTHKKKRAMRNVYFLCMLLIAITGCSQRKKELQEYRPMVCIGGELYGEAGDSEKILPDVWKNIGSITKKVSNVEPMPKEEFVSNTLEVGTEIYGNSNEANKIYVKLSEDKYILYILLLDIVK